MGGGVQGGPAEVGAGLGHWLTLTMAALICWGAHWGGEEPSRPSHCSVHLLLASSATPPHLGVPSQSFRSLGALACSPAPLDSCPPNPPWIGVSPASSGSLMGKLGLTREHPPTQLAPFCFLKKCRQIQWNSPSQSSHPEQDSC